MGNDAKRTPGKLRSCRVSFNRWRIETCPEDGCVPVSIAMVTMTLLEVGTGSEGEHAANAAFIVRACNAHDALVAACRALVVQLRFRTPGSYEGVRINSVAELRAAHEAALATIALAMEAADAD